MAPHSKQLYETVLAAANFSVNAATAPNRCRNNRHVRPILALTQFDSLTNVNYYDNIIIKNKSNNNNITKKKNDSKTITKGKKLSIDSTGAQLLKAVQKNNLRKVQYHLEHGANPNVRVGLLSSSSSSSTSSTRKSELMDKVFSWKKCLGESPTLLHLAILNVYHQSCSVISNSSTSSSSSTKNHYHYHHHHHHQQQQRENRNVEKALNILQLFMLHNAKVSTKTYHLFLRGNNDDNNENTTSLSTSMSKSSSSSSSATTPIIIVETDAMDFALGLERLAVFSSTNKSNDNNENDIVEDNSSNHYHKDKAMADAIDILRGYHESSEEEPTTRAYNSSTIAGKLPLDPYSCTWEEESSSVDLIRNFAFVSLSSSSSSLSLSKFSCRSSNMDHDDVPVIICLE